jgi:hypothetical protein
MPYYQWSAKMDLANWKTATIDFDIPQKDPLIQIAAFARVDGKGEFWEPGPNDASLVYTNGNPPGPTIKINRTGFHQDAGQLDFRFHVHYLPGAFQALQPWDTVSWRRTPKIRQITVDYDRPTQTLYHEDR